MNDEKKQDEAARRAEVEEKDEKHDRPSNVPLDEAAPGPNTRPPENDVARETRKNDAPSATEESTGIPASEAEEIDTSLDDLELDDEDDDGIEDDEEEDETDEDC